MSKFDMTKTKRVLFFCLMFTAPLVYAGFDEAAAAFAAGDYTKALIDIRPLAEQGDARGQYSMGVLYENGFGVVKDPQQAAAWYLKAALQGNSDAQYNLGAMNEHGTGIPVNYVEAARWYRPVAAFGNSDGDLQMLQWTCVNPQNSFCLYVHHTDAEREFSYGRQSHIGKLDKGLDEAQAKGWTVVDMKNDWKVIYPPANAAN